MSERLPRYERHAIVWPMGSGEHWLGPWHAPAPFTCADFVLDVLHPSSHANDVDDGGTSELITDAMVALTHAIA